MNKKVKLDKTEIISAKIHALSHDGRGITQINNKTAFIDGALPGEEITCRLIKKRRQIYEGEVVALRQNAAERVPAICSHFGVCGGCSLQHLNMQSQLELKQQTLLEQFKHFGQVTPDIILPPLNADTEGYRRKARLGVKYVIKKNKLLVGFREKSSNYLADLSECAVLHPHIGKRLPALSALVASLEAYQAIPQIEVAVGDEEAALIFRHLTPLNETDQQKLIQFGQTYSLQIYLQPNAPASLSKLYPPDRDDQLSYTLPDQHLTFLFHPLDFTQINLSMNRKMINQALALLKLEASDRVLDLFCGIGNFSLPIAQQVKQVVGVEGSQEMVSRSEANAAFNQIHNTAFYAANLEAPDTAAMWLQNTYDKILLDPPRAGAKAILPFLAQMNAKRIVYVSCNPSTLARDAKDLVHHHHYRLTQAGIMNMFPHTSHIEAMALFEK